ncbi:PREDICTED: uncharacterized protein LOC109346956 [Lupinus angustifolius]|uniref:uncharacterized protein LOC109346956 n=1 Tax=Lupinus angustifolius TaxID=3871 RepID=UPI00092F9C41|nr:PREDICTED: uncharacterized protein LOC109346956 [Lupinus angustifolius]
MDGVVIANEVIDQAKKNNFGDCFIFKVDFEKAYVCVNWSFLLYMMERMGFCLKWRSWIKSCLQSNSISILVNGSPTAEFNMTRGLRQGDPIAPFLFLIVAEGLAGIMRSAVSQRIFTGYSVGRDEVIVSHLLYADDTLLIGEMSEGKLTFKFLGIPVGANPRRISTWGPVVEAFKKKLSFWQQKLIPKSVLSSLPIYFFSFYKAPVSVIHELDKIQRRFLWGRSEVNKGKWRWRFLHELESLWVRVVHSKYGVGPGGFREFRGDECFRKGLFQIAMDKNAFISSMGEWRNDVWCWNLEWRRHLFSWEREEVEALLNSIKEVRILQDIADGWLWMHDKGGLYSVRSAYNVFLNEDNGYDSWFYKKVWGSNVPLKLRCFVWRLSVDGIPTRLNLVRIGILSLKIKHDAYFVEWWKNLSTICSSPSPSLIFCGNLSSLGLNSVLFSQLVLGITSYLIGVLCDL